jgi:anti-sigma factor RsiW
MSAARRQGAAARRPRARKTAGGHGAHSRAYCLKILKELSSYLDDDLARNLSRKVAKHLEACANCEDFVASLRQTIILCKHSATSSLSPTAKAKLRGQILKAVAGL